MSKKALLIVSFGTSYPETRQKTIEAIEAYLAQAFPERDSFRAWTSRFIIKKVAREQDLVVMTPEEALERLEKEGYTDVLVQPTHLTDGYENRRLIGILEEHAEAFESVRLGRPLLFFPEDKAELVDILDQVYPRQTGEVLVLMGHGSEDRPTPDYDELNALMARRQVPDMVVGTVEGAPGLQPVEERLQELAGPEAAAGAVHTLLLAPLMIVAGDHANNDLAGEGSDSWKSLLEAKGYRICAHLNGLGEYEQIQQKFVRHAQEATPLAEWR